MRSLTRIQFGDPGAVATAGLPLTTDVVQAGTTNVLRELKGSSLGSGMNHMDSMTLDIMAMLFDQLFDEPRIPIGVKGLIGRLQIPMLKVAIADKTFFSRKTHPARQMLDTLGEISTRLPADFDVSNPMYARLEAILHEVIDKFEDNVEIFNGVRERLQTLVAEEDKRIEQETQSSAKKVEQKENLAVAKAVAQAEIKVRIRGARVPVPVLKFLIEEWIKLLIVVEVKHGDSSEEWKNALKTIELLVWSVEPKETEEDRRKLVAMLPDLLRRLIAGAQLAGIEEDVRTRFFADLRKLHTDSVGKAAEVDATADAEGVAPLEPQPEPTPESSAPEEMAPLDFGSPDAERTEAKVPSETPQEVLSPAPAQASPLLPELPEMGSTPPGPLIPDLPGFPPSSKPEAPLPPELPDMLLPPARESPPAAESQQAAPAEESPLVPELPDLVFTPREAASRPPAPQTPAVSSPLLPELPDLSFTPREAAPQPSQASAPASGQAPKPTAPPEAPAPRPAASQTPPPPPRTAQPHPAPPRAPAPPQATPAPPRAPGAPRSAQQGTPAARAPQQPAAAPRAPAQPAQGAARGTPAPAARPAAAAQGRQPAPPAAGAPNFTAAVTVKNPFGEGKVEVDDLDFTTKPAAAPARGKPEADPDLPANFVVGTWVDIRDKDSHRPAKLTFVSPLKTRYLFVNRQGKNTLECSRAELVRRLRLGEITIAKETPDAPLFDRLMGDLVNKLAGPTGKS